MSFTSNTRTFEITPVSSLEIQKPSKHKKIFVREHSSGHFNPGASNPKISTDPPTYSPPYQGLVSRLPLYLVPYAELMRLHKPTGYYAFLYPHLFGILFGATQIPNVDPAKIIYTIAIHLASSLVLRGAACTWNDTLDAPFDRQVTRSRNRPVARGAVQPNAAHLFTAAQTLIWVVILVNCLPPACLTPATALAATMAVYPFCKRVTNFPQVVLGFSLALGQTVGIASLGIAPWETLRTPAAQQGAIVCLYLANVLNAVVYDTVYAHQDLKDDLKAGIMSMAVACGSRTKQVLSVLCLIEVALLAGAAYLSGFGGVFWLTGVCGTAAVLSWMIAAVNLEDPESCWRWFNSCIHFTGGILCIGLAGEYAVRAIA